MTYEHTLALINDLHRQTDGLFYDIMRTLEDGKCSPWEASTLAIRAMLGVQSFIAAIQAHPDLSQVAWCLANSQRQFTTQPPTP
jgi:hypothetical protein